VHHRDRHAGETTSSRYPGYLLDGLGAVPAGALVVGNPAYAVQRGLRRLPGAGVEALAIGRLRRQEPLIDEAAQGDAVLERIDAAGVVHLATHGLLRDRAPYSAELALAGQESSPSPT
jgi:CHAT domain-containing protein